MPFLITMGLGTGGPTVTSTLLSTEGLGSPSFSGDSDGLIALVRILEAKIVEIIYRVPVSNSALVLSNYEIQPGIEIQNIKLTEAFPGFITYQLTTDRLRTGESYTLTVSNISTI